MKILSIQTSWAFVSTRPPAELVNVLERPIRPRVQGQVLRRAARCGRTRHPQAAGKRDHRAVVGAKLRPRKIQLRSALERDGSQPFAQFPVSADAPGDDQAPMSGCTQCSPGFLRERVDHRFLEAARDIGAYL